MNTARISAFDEMSKDPLGFLTLHFELTPKSPHKEIVEIFMRFGKDTGKSDETIALAVAGFIENQEVADFVKQAASAEKTKLFSDSL